MADTTAETTADWAEAIQFVERAGRAAAARLQQHPQPVRAGDDAFVGLAAEVGGRITRRAAEADASGRLLLPNYEDLRDAGFLALAVPTELGGKGATLRQVCYAQTELARHCASTALAVAMHLHGTLSAAWR